jgi:peptide/nickel transport system permease protein
MGTLLVGSILDRDYPIVQAGILVLALNFAVINLVTDLLYAVIDPRIRYE